MIDCLYDKFKHWGQAGSVWIISDTHFNDSDCSLMDFYWPDPMDFIKKINSKCGKNDTLIHLGDVGDTSYLSYLRAKYKILIKGNHDIGAKAYEPYFDEIYSGPLIISDKLILSHEPIFGVETFLFNLHGHDHQGEFHEGHWNVAANVCGYDPLNLGAAIKKGMLARTNSIHRITIDAATEKKLLKSKEI